MKTETGKPQLLVVSIPAGLDVDAIQRLMNEPLQDGDYYFGALVPHGPGLLALFRLRAEKERVDKAAPDEEGALATLKASPQLSADKVDSFIGRKGHQARTAMGVHSPRGDGLACLTISDCHRTI